jgi:glycosyltransferase involved in cell wall biosynthesis
MCPVPDPAVSVIIATYNWSTVLPFSIGSVLQQTFADFELLVVGDGCTDDSEQVVRAIDDPRVTWVNIPRSGHQSGPNNEGLRRARGRIIAYLGHDDLWLPHHLALHVAAIDAGNDFTVSLVAAAGPDNAFIESGAPRPNENRWSPPSASAHRLSLVKEAGAWRDYRELDMAPEQDLWRRFLAAGARFSVVPRLTVIKLGAWQRRDVYHLRPCHEQAAWMERIRTEPDLEAALLGGMMAAPSARMSSFGGRLRRVIAEPSQWFSLIWRRGGSGIRARQRFKGVDDAGRSAEGRAGRHQ